MLFCSIVAREKKFELQSKKELGIAKYGEPACRLSPVRPETEGVCQDLAVDGDELFHGGQICLVDMSLEAAVLSLQQVLAVLHQPVVVGDEAAPGLAGFLSPLHQLHLVPPPYFEPDLHDEPQLV